MLVPCNVCLFVFITFGLLLVLFALLYCGFLLGLDYIAVFFYIAVFPL